MITVLSVVGTRPEAIKMAPVIRELRRRSDRMRSLVCSVGQHRHLLDQALNLFQIAPDYELDVMRTEQSLATLTASLFSGLETVIADAKPDWILAQGDTTTVFVAAMQAFYHRIPFGHVEAGLRTGQRYSPFPEEINRRIADLVSTVYFAPTPTAREALLREGCSAKDIYVTGNTVIDALHDVASREYEWESGPLAQVPKDAPLVLVTAHRRESFGGPFRELCLAIRDLAHRWAKQGVYFVYPVHLNPNVRRPVAEILSDLPHVKLIEPLDYLSLVHLMKRSVLVLTDSGGIQEEAPGLHVPVLVMRETTERPEGLHTGLVQLVGTDRARIMAAAETLLRSRGMRRAAIGASPYGDGQAARRIVSILLERSSDRRDVDAPEIPAATPLGERATAPLQ